MMFTHSVGCRPAYRELPATVTTSFGPQFSLEEDQIRALSMLQPVPRASSLSNSSWVHKRAPMPTHIARAVEKSASSKQSPFARIEQRSHTNMSAPCSFGLHEQYPGEGVFGFAQMDPSGSWPGVHVTSGMITRAVSGHSSNPYEWWSSLCPHTPCPSVPTSQPSSPQVWRLSSAVQTPDEKVSSLLP